MTKARLLLALLLSTGCKDKPKEVAAPPATTVEPGSAAANPAASAGSASAAAPTIRLAAGESFQPSADLTRVGPNPNPFTWQATPTDAVAIGVVFKDETARAVAAVEGESIDIATVEFNAAYSGEYAITTSPDNKVAVIITSNGGSGDPGFIAAWQVAWDPAAKKPIVAAKGDWPADEADKTPAWAKLPER